MTVTDYSPLRWEEASPGNVSGEARALTAIGPLRRNWRYLLLLAGFFLRRYVWLFRAAKVKPLRGLGFIHFARWVLIKDPLDTGGLTYMFFESNFNGGFDEYIDAFAYVIPDAMEDIFGSVHNFPGPVPATAFKDFIRRHDYEADHFFSAYPEATSNDVAGAVQLKRALDELCRRPDGNAFEFAAAWRELLTKAQGWL